MANLNISGYTFSTTSVPTSPALKVKSGTDTYYVNLTTGQRPEALSDQKVFTVSTTDYSFLRPFVTSNSLTGYSGVSNNSTVTTGYSGVSNNSTKTTGYAGVSNNSTVTTGYSGVSNNSTKTTGYAGVSKTQSVDSETHDAVFRYQGVSYLDTRFISAIVYEYTDSTRPLLDPDIAYRKGTGSTYSTSYGSAKIAPFSSGTWCFSNAGYGGYSASISITPGNTTSSNPAAYHGGPIGECHERFYIPYITGSQVVVYYSVTYKMTNTYSAEMGLGWVYKSSMTLRPSGYNPLTPYGVSHDTHGTLSFFVNKTNVISYATSVITASNNAQYIRVTSSGLIVSGTLNSSSTAKGNLSSITDLTRTATRYSSSTAKAYLSSITDLTRSTTRYSSSTTVGNLSSVTALTVTTTRYSSSTAKAYLSSITSLTKSATRYSSSTTVGNLSSTTELRTVTRL